MGKRKNQQLLESGSSSDGSESSGSDIDKDMLALTKKKGTKKEVKAEVSGSESDSDWGDNKKGKKNKKPAKRARRSTSGTTKSSVSSKDEDSNSDDNNMGSENDSDGGEGVPPTSSSVVSSTVADVKRSASDLEEGEVSDDDLDQEEFFDGYDENLMGDAEDQMRLNAMTEKEREQEIFRRIEKRDFLKNRFEAEKKLRLKKKLEAKLSKGSSKKLEDMISMENMDGFPVEAKMRSQERKKTVENKMDKKSQAMDALKASRDAKKQKAEEKEKKEKKRHEKRDDGDEEDADYKKESDTASSMGEKKTKRLRASDVYSDDSGSDYDDESRGRDRNRSGSDSDSHSSDSESEDSRKKQPKFVDSVLDLNRIRLSRFKLERWLYLPIFEKAVTGCYVRLGMTGPGQKNQYKVYEVVGVDVQPGRVYKLGKARTNKVLLLRLPGDRVEGDGGDSNQKAGRKYRMEYISNSEFTEAEFQTWRQRMEFHQIQIPTISDIEKKEKEISSAMEYQLLDEDVEKIIEEKSKLKIAPVNFAAKKTQLMKEKDIANGIGDTDAANRLQQEINDLDEKAKELDKVRTHTISSISYINERNRKKNVEEAEKAILEELKVNKGRKLEDPFTRRTTKPRIVSKAVTNGNVKTAGDEDVKPNMEDNSLANLTLDDGKLNLDELDGEPGSSLPLGDLFSAHDFDIKLDLDAKLPLNIPIVAKPSITPIKDSAPRRSLNLEEYKRKKGLI